MIDHVRDAINMFRAVRTPAFALIGLLAVSCQDANPPTPSGPPRIHVEESDVDVGEIPISGDGLKSTFRLVNRGLAPLEITAIEIGCSCMDAEVSRAVIAPEANASIVVRVRADRPGERASHVIIHSNDPQRPRSRLTVRWRAVAPLEFEPLVLNFGIVRPGSVIEQRVRLNRTGIAGAADCRVLRVEPPTDARLTANLRESEDRKEAVDVTLSAGLRSGRHSAQVRLSLLRCWTDQLTLPVEWEVRDLIETTPDRLMLGFGRSGECLEKRGVVNSDPAERLSISEPVLKQNAWATARIVESGPSLAIIEVTARLPEAPGEYSDELQIECVAPEERTIALPVVAVVLGDG